MNESTQSFKEWGQDISAKLSAAGFEKTGDSGTIYFYTPEHVSRKKKDRVVMGILLLVGGIVLGALGAFLWAAVPLL